jgi:hypothetical protein
MVVVMVMAAATAVPVVMERYVNRLAIDLMDFKGKGNIFDEQMKKC